MRPIQSRAFRLGFILGILACVILNYLSYLDNVCPDTIDDCGWRFGVPVPLYAEGGFVSYQEIIFLGLITDVFFAVTASALVGLLFRFVGSKIVTPQDQALP